MYEIKNSIVLEAITSESRTFRAKIDFFDADGNLFRTFSGQDVGHVTIERAQTETDTLQIGGVLAGKVQFQLCCGYLPQRGDVFRLYLYLLDTAGTGAEPVTHRIVGQWSHRELYMLSHSQIAVLPTTKDIDGRPLEDYFIPFGEFVVHRAVVDGSLVRVTAYDKLYAADAPYLPAIGFPATSVEVTEDVMQQLGIPHRKAVVTGNLVEADGETVLGSDGEEILVSAEHSFMIEATDVAGMTCREVLGGIAAVSGGNALLDRDGDLTVQFVDDHTHYLTDNRIDTPEIGDTEQTIPGMRCEVNSSTELTAGAPDQEGAIAFFCPWMTAQRFRALWFRFRHIRWRPGVVYERLGDPRRDLGDLLGYTLPAAAGRPWINCKLQLTGIRYEFDGGLSAELTSCGTMEV